MVRTMLYEYRVKKLLSFKFDWKICDLHRLLLTYFNLYIANNFSFIFTSFFVVCTMLHQYRVQKLLSLLSSLLDWRYATCIARSWRNTFSFIVTFVFVVRTSHAAWISSDEVTKLWSLLDWRYTTCIACYWRFSISYKKTYLILLLSSNLFSVVPQVAEWASESQVNA